MKPLGERRVHELLGELEMMGILKTSNISRGRGGYAKIITLNKNAEDILDAIYPKWRTVGEED